MAHKLDRHDDDPLAQMGVCKTDIFETLDAPAPDQQFSIEAFLDMLEARMRRSEWER
ncbi:MAG: hypothetical protein AAF409_02010 [Pseudomonadota bacterium]